VGAALLDPGDPGHVLARSEQPILTVQQPYEREGTVPDVVFVEGMVLRGDQLEVWYGGGDRVIGRAVVPWP
jgi:beta-1,2-mannobiose phosphorylase / 1,2-beta-oligomannan phosphorylase